MTRSISSQMDSIRDQHSACIKRQDACFRTLRDGNMNELRDVYGELNDAHKAQAWGHLIGIFGSFCSIFASGFGEHDKFGNGLRAVGATIDKSAGFKNKLDDTDIVRYQGLLEQIRKELENTESENRELIQMLHEIERMLDDAKSKAERNLSTPFDKASG